MNTNLTIFPFIGTPFLSQDITTGGASSDSAAAVAEPTTHAD
jgi:hypothetical protein